jgi:ABC-type Fe3+/spermidine/putrescine transport system ATPase subunit
VEKRYDDIPAAENLNLEVRDGEYLCLLGPTGAGKTTALRIICGLTDLDSGKVFIGGKDVTDLEPERRGTALLSQTYSLFPQLTVAENILFGPDIRDLPEEERRRTLADMLDLVRLTKRPDALPSELSGGMSQRTALAVTHDQDEALVMADRIALIRNGHVLQVGEPSQVYDNPVSPFVANFVGQSNFVTGRIIEKGEKTAVRTESGRTVFARQCAMDVGEQVVVGVKIGNTEIAREGDSFFEGIVERVLFEGRNLHVDLLVEGTAHFSAKIPSWRMGKLTAGDKVMIKWNAEKASVFPMPEKGLREELKVE